MQAHCFHEYNSSEKCGEVERNKIVWSRLQISTHMVMLWELLTESSFEFSLLLEDSAEKCGSYLVSTIINETSNKDKNVICVFTEPEFSPHPQYENGKVRILNVFHDFELLLDKIVTVASQAECVVVFPSLSLLLLNYGISSFGELFRQLKDNERISSVIALIHTDVVDSEQLLQQTEYMFDAVVNVSSVQEPELVSSYYGHAKCTRRKASGKVDNSDEYFTLDKNMNVDQVHASSSAVIKSLVIEVSAADITSSLTFNLSLSATERKAKNKLQLPYLKKDAEKVEMLSKSNSRSGAPLVKIGESETTSNTGGKIYYHYDEADDFDEEDPDDDLNI